VLKFIKPQNIIKIFRLCIFVGFIQLPVIIFQIIIFDKLPYQWIGNTMNVDFAFGTFNFRCDYAMSFFLIVLTIFLLFDNKHNYFVKRKFLLAGYFTLTILIGYSQLSKLIVIFIWFAYGWKFLGIRTLGIIIISGVITILTIFALQKTGIIKESPLTFINRIQTNWQMRKSPESYLIGKSSRGAALFYFLNKDISLIGDGPSKYHDVFSRKLFRGNMGHIFTFYSEVGLIGWLISELILLLIAFRHSEKPLYRNWVAILAFISISILSFTNEVMNDISIMLIYCILASSSLIPSDKTKMIVAE